MAINETLLKRIRDVLARKRGIEEKRMFGCVGFLLHGHVFVGVWKDSLIVRTGPAAYVEARFEPHVREFNITGKPMKGWIVVDPDGVEHEVLLAEWIERAIQFAKTLPKR
jgi:TfoX/Sxy family transcriptional regulator of competence genes